jgi:hypothetical protein
MDLMWKIDLAKGVPSSLVRVDTDPRSSNNGTETIMGTPAGQT